MYLLTFCIVSANLVSQICFDCLKCTVSAEPKPKLIMNFHKDVKTTLLKNVRLHTVLCVVWVSTILSQQERYLCSILYFMLYALHGL